MSANSSYADDVVAVVSTESQVDANGVDYDVAYLSDGTYMVYGWFGLPSGADTVTINSPQDVPKVVIEGTEPALEDAPAVNSSSGLYGGEDTSNEATTDQPADGGTIPSEDDGTANRAPTTTLYHAAVLRSDCSKSTPVKPSSRTFSRKDLCTYHTYSWAHIQGKAIVGYTEGLAVGRMNLGTYSDSTTKTLRINYIHRTVTTSGDMANGTINLYPTCTSSCSSATGSQNVQYGAGGYQYRTSADYIVPVGPKQVKQFQPGLGVAAKLANGVVLEFPGKNCPEISCDNNVYANLAGCAFRRIGSVLVYSLTGHSRKGNPYFEVARHVRDAQNAISTHPGRLINWQKAGRSLTRTNIPLEVAQNRAGKDTACNKLARPIGKQCDEYPFASSAQGARLGAGNFSVRMVTALHNSTAGGVLSELYNIGRVGQGGEFWVAIVP